MDKFYQYFIALALMFYFVGFIVKNISTARRTRQAIKGNSIKVKMIFLTTTILYLLSYINIIIGTDFLFSVDWLDHRIVKLIGLIIVFISLLLGLASLISMRDSWRVGIRPEQKTQLITNGIFRFSRNPYFLSYILIFLGCFLVIPTYAFLIVYLVWIILTHMMILDEEKHLINQHGDLYKEYKNRVNRYIIVK